MKYMVHQQITFFLPLDTFSIILMITLAINVFFIFSKGTKNFTDFHENVYDLKWVIPTSLGIGVVVGLMWLWPIGPYAKRRLQARKEERDVALATQAILDANKLSTDSTGANETAKTKLIGARRMVSSEQLFAGELDPEEGSIKISLKEPRAINETDSTQRTENRSSNKVHALRDLGGSIGSIKICIDEPIEEEAEVSDNKSFNKRLRLMSADLSVSVKEALDGSFAKQMESQMHPKLKQSKKKKNILVRFEEATFKQDLEEQAFEESKDTHECWQAAETYDSEVEQLYTYVQAFTAALR